MQKIVAPEFELQSFNCPICHAFAEQKFEQIFVYLANANVFGTEKELYEPLTFEYPEDVESHGLPQDDNSWYVSICHSCKKSSFWNDTQLVFPKLDESNSFPQPSEDMPTKVAELYKEASAVFPVSKRASAALMRAAAEQLVYELTKEELPKAKLNGRINYLSKSVPEHIFKALTIIRAIGNKVLHPSDEEKRAVTIYLDEEVEGIPGALANSLNALVNEFITNRNLVDRMFDDLPESILAGVANTLKSYENNETELASEDE